MVSRSVASICAFGSATILASGMSFAGGYVEPTVPAAPQAVENSGPDWGGAYIGGSLGYQFGGDDIIGLEAAGFDENNLGSVDIDGVNAGLTAGYRWTLGSWVVGPSLSVMGSQAEAVDEFDRGTLTSTSNYLLSLQWKSAYKLNSDSLVYGTIGATHGDFDYSMNYLTDPGNTQVVNYSDTGLSLGIGFERRLNDRLSMFAEWEMYQFGKTDVFFQDPIGGETRTEATPEHQNIKVGVNFEL